MSPLTAYTLWRPKAGNADDEYEDAYYSAKRAGGAARIAFAIADGATESLLSRHWANLLVKRFVRQWERPEWLERWLASTWRAWAHEKREYIRRRERAHKPIQWYEEPGLQAGAFAALLGLVVTRAPRHLVWHAIALGDCCLAQVRDNFLLRAFPIGNADAFNNRPILLGSNPARNAAEHFSFADGTLTRGDRMYLMTDALAAWFLRANEQGAQPWQELDAFRAPDAFAAWLTEKRAAHAMRNDDVTLIRLAWE